MPRIDHVVLLVADLWAARREFEQSGFTVVAGGTHAGGLTQNALIPFADGSYVELLAFTWSSALRDLDGLERLDMLAWILPGRTPLDRRFLPRGAAPGLVDLAIGCTGLDDICSRCRDERLHIEGPLDGSRIRPDGQRVEWRLAFPQDPHLPFLIEDVTDRRLRVPSGLVTQHANEVTGIAGATYILPKEASVVFNKLTSALECAPARREGDTDVWTVGNASLSVITTATSTSIRPASLALRGSRPAGAIPVKNVQIVPG